MGGLYKAVDEYGILSVGKLGDLQSKYSTEHGIAFKPYMLSDWLRYHSCDLDAVKIKEDVQVEYESHYDDDTDTKIMLKLNFKERYVYCFILLVNNKAVALNENPSRGYSFPVINRWREKLGSLYTDK